MTTEWFSNDLLTPGDIGMWVWGVDRFGSFSLFEFHIKDGKKLFQTISSYPTEELYGADNIIGWTPLIRPTTHTVMVAKRRPSIRGNHENLAR